MWIEAARFCRARMVVEQRRRTRSTRCGNGIHHSPPNRARSAVRRNLFGKITGLQRPTWLAKNDEPGLERRAQPRPREQTTCAPKYSPTRFFASDHLAADCRSYQ